MRSRCGCVKLGRPTRRGVTPRSAFGSPSLCRRTHSMTWHRRGNRLAEFRCRTTSMTVWSGHGLPTCSTRRSSRHETSAKAGVEVLLYRAVERIWNVGGEGGAVAPRHLCQLLIVGHARGAAHDVARDVQHGSAGVGVDAFAKVAGRSYGEAGLL